MMLAVDEYNGCFSPTTLKNTQKEWVRPSLSFLFISLSYTLFVYYAGDGTPVESSQIHTPSCPSGTYTTDNIL